MKRSLYFLYTVVFFALTLGCAYGAWISEPLPDKSNPQMALGVMGGIICFLLMIVCGHKAAEGY